MVVCVSQFISTSKSLYLLATVEGIHQYKDQFRWYNIKLDRIYRCKDHSTKKHVIWSGILFIVVGKFL